MKTGTPARIDGRSINFDVLEEQKGDGDYSGFSFMEIELLKTNKMLYNLHK